MTLTHYRIYLFNKEGAYKFIARNRYRQIQTLLGQINREEVPGITGVSISPKAVLVRCKHQVSIVNGQPLIGLMTGEVMEAPEIYWETGPSMLNPFGRTPKEEFAGYTFPPIQ